MTRVLVIDNYDSFTWNLVHLIGPLVDAVEVVRNDAITVDDASRRRAGRDRAVARPLHPERGRHLPRADRATAGPRDPDLRRLPRPAGDRPGLRRRGRARAGADARQGLGRVAHGRRASSAASTGRSRRRATIRSSSTATPARAISRSRPRPPTGSIMGLSHRDPADPRRAVPPESILSEHGEPILRNFLDLAAAWNRESVTIPARAGALNRAWNPSSPTSPRSRPAPR